MIQVSPEEAMSCLWNIPMLDLADQLQFDRYIPPSIALIGEHLQLTAGGTSLDSTNL